MIQEQYYCYDSSRNVCGCSAVNAMDSIFSDKTKKMQNLQELVVRIIDDNAISDDEIIQLKNWLEQHDDLKGFYPFDKIFELVEEIMPDGVMSKTEEQELLKLLDAIY